MNVRSRIVVLCGRAPRHLQFANRLGRAADVAAVVQEAPRRCTWQRLRRALRPRRVRDRILARLGQAVSAEARFFFGDRSPALDQEERRHVVRDVNHPSVLELIERVEPRVIAVFGTSLIRAPLLGRMGMINLHPGIAPRYRGVDCAFWALYNGEPEHVGATLHWIDDGIDTGRLLAHVRPAITPADDDRTLLWKVARDGAEAFAELLAKLESGAPIGVRQADRGRLYQARERTSACERELRSRLAAGLLAGRERERRVTWFDAGS